MKSSSSAPSRPKTHSRFRPPDVQQVSVGGFWADRVAATAEKTIPILQLRCDEAGMLDQIDPARPVPEQRIPFSTAFGGGKVRPVGGNVTAQMYWDSDVAKMVEAAALSLVFRRNPAVEAMIDPVIDMYEALQQADGYLNSWYIRMQPGKSWTNLRDCHELYCAGHLIEAAVAYLPGHRQAQVHGRHGPLCRPHRQHVRTRAWEAEGYCGHEEIELALVKFARATGEQRYMELAKILHRRAWPPAAFFPRLRRGACRGAGPVCPWQHLRVQPVACAGSRADKVVGHAVRAMYLYSAMADIVTEYGDERCERLSTGSGTTSSRNASISPAGSAPRRQ